MADQTKNPFMDMFQDFGKSMSIPGPDLNTMMDHHRKNLQALQAAAQVSSDSTQALMKKQREALEQTLADISSSVQNATASGDPSKMATASMDIARKAFDATLKTTPEMAEIVRKGSADTFEVLKDRVMESVEELQPEKKKS